MMDRLLLEDRLRRRAAAPPRFRFPDEYEALKERAREWQAAGCGPVYGAASEGLNTNLTRIAGRELVNYAGYNYLGLSGDPAVARAAKDAIDRYGTSVSASRVASGERPLHRELERAIAKLLGCEDAIAFVGGFATNETVIGHLCGPGDLILYDSLIHASVQAGCKLSGAAARRFPHNDWEALDRVLGEERRKHRQVLIVIEGVYSMEGDVPDLPRFIEVKDRHTALLMVDEAHSIGVLGRTGAGIGEHFGVSRAAVDIWMGTLSKSFAGCGGYIAGTAELVEYLRYTVPGYVYSVGMTPPNAAASLAAIGRMLEEPERLARLRARADLFRELAHARGLNTGSSRFSAVVPVFVGPELACVRLYQALFDAGILALPMVYPAVPENSARIRFFLSCLHTEEQIRSTVDVIAA